MKKTITVHRSPIIKLPSEFVQSLESHYIYNHEELAKTFEAECGIAPHWHTQTIAEVKKALRKRGLGGGVDGKPKTLTVTGLDVAVYCARHFVPNADHSLLNRLHGMGSQFREALRILKEGNQ